MIPAERVPSASLLLRHRDDRGRSAARPDRDGPVPAPRRRPLRGRSVPGAGGVGVGEKQVIQMALDKGVLEPTWDFVPVGNRLRFDLTFLIERATKWKLIEWDLARLKYYWFTKPYVDLGPILVMLNRGSLSGSSLHNFSDKESGARVPRMYLAGRYSDIIDYVTRERNAAVDLLREGRNVLGAMGDTRRRPPSPPEQAPGP